MVVLKARNDGGWRWSGRIIRAVRSSAGCAAAAAATHSLVLVTQKMVTHRRDGIIETNTESETESEISTRP